MNEEVKKIIAKASGKSIEHVGGYGWDFEERLIEVTVEQCTQLLQDSAWNLPHGYTVKDQADYIKKHFEVKQ